MMPQQYCLRWKHHHSNVQNMFAQLLEKERFCDVTLYCSPSFASQVPNKDTVEPHSIRGVSLRAHRVVLAACSELLGTLLGAHEAHGEPVLVIDGAEPRHLRALLDYMYTGEMNVHHSQLASLLKTAEELRIKGLTDIRWNNKDEPPDCASGAVATTTLKQDTADKPDTETETKQKPSETKHKPAETKHKPAETKHKPAETKHKPAETKHKSEAKKNAAQTLADVHISEPRTLKEDIDKVNINGGPPPLIKLPLPKSLMTPKRENSDSDSPSPKRRRVASGADNTDDESNHTIKLEKDGEWQHGSMDISASRVGWGGMSGGSQSDDEWADAPADIGSFLHTRLRVDGDNSADEESNDSSAVGHTGRDEGSPILAPTPPLKTDPLAHVTIKPTVGPKSGPTDPRFTDVIKLNDYLQHGRRPQFWEEHYVKRVMEAVRLKELEMKQAAEILGVSYGTLYGRYRDVYGCINRPYRAVRDFWQVKGPSEVLERLQRGELSLEAAAGALGVSVANLAAHLADFPHPHPPTLAEASVKYESFPIEIDQSLRARSFSSGPTNKPLVRIAPKVSKMSTNEDELIPASIISTGDAKEPTSAGAGNTAAPAEFEPIPIEMDPSLRARTSGKPLVRIAPKVSKMSTNEDELIPASIISTGDAKEPTSAGAGNTAGGKWPTIRVASIDSLRSEPPAPASPSPSPSPSQLMRTRPDLTIVAKRPDSKEDT